MNFSLAVFWNTCDAMHSFFFFFFIVFFCFFVVVFCFFFVCFFCCCCFFFCCCFVCFCFFCFFFWGGGRGEKWLYFVFRKRCYLRMFIQVFVRMETMWSTRLFHRLHNRDFLWRLRIFYAILKEHIFREMTTDIENRLKHPVNLLSLCAFLSWRTRPYTLQYLVIPFHNRKFPPISHTSDLGLKFGISFKRYLWKQFHSPRCYRRLTEIMLNYQRFQCCAADH